MNERLYIEGQLVQTGGVQIVQNYQINDLASLQNRQCSYTNQFKLPATPANVELFDMLGVPGSNSTTPYRKLSAKLVSAAGYDLISNGTAKVQEVDNGYNVALYDGNNTLFEAIGDKSIRDLDFTDINHEHTVANIQGSFTNTSGYVHAVFGPGEVDYERRGLLSMHTDTWLACVFASTLLDKIITEAGFTYEGNFLTDPKFINLVLAPASGYDLSLPALIDYSLIVPDIKQVDFVKEIMQRFAVFFERDRADPHIVFRTAEDLFNDRDNAGDWSGKYAGHGPKSHDPGTLYAQVNRFAYKYEDREKAEALARGSLIRDFRLLPDLLDGFMSVDNKLLDYKEKTVVQSLSNFALPLNLTDDGTVEVYILPLFIDKNDVPEVIPSVSKTMFFEIGDQTPTILLVEGNIYDNDGTYTQLNGAKPFLRFPPYQEYVDAYYTRINATFDRYKRINALIRLDDTDVYNFKFLKLQYVKQLGAYFYVNKIKYTGSPVTEVELIEVK